MFWRLLALRYGFASHIEKINNGDKMPIRKAELSDARGIAEVHAASWQTAYRGFFPDDFLDNLSADKRETYWQEAIELGRSGLLVYEKDGAIIGFASFGESRDEGAVEGETAELYAIYFDPVQWGKGYGAELGAEVLEALKAQRFPEVTLWVLKDNQRAIRFYEKLGFVPDGVEKVETWRGEIELTESRYRLWLAD